MSRTDAQARAEDVARAAYGKLIAMLASRTGDIIAAEDALADAFVAALKTWPERGIPDKPEAWLLTVAKNRRIDQARRDARLVITDEANDMADAQAIEPDDTQLDERLKLLFVCAHPAIDATIRTPLMLQTVLGLEAEQIAKAFLVKPATMAQRLVRAKKKIKTAGIPFVVPEPDAYPERMGAVLEAVYGAYSVDWLEGDGDISHEAFFLSNILAQLAPEDAETLGLTALIGFIEARRDARISDGVLVPVPEQDTNLWDNDLIERSVSVLTQASLKRAPRRMPGRFQLEAAIQAVHAARSVTGKTDWRALSQLYAGLMKAYPSIGGAVSRAAVVAEDAGPLEGLKMLDVIQFDGVNEYQPFHAVRAHCLALLGQTADAAEAYANAVALCTDRPSELWLEKKISDLRKKWCDLSIGEVGLRRVGRREEKLFQPTQKRTTPMTIVFTIASIIAAIALVALLLPRKVVVTRQANIAMRPEDVISRVASTDGFQTFNPYCTTDPDLQITPFGPAAGIGSGFRFEGKEGKGTQTVTDVTATCVTHLIDLGAMGKPVQTIEVVAQGEGSLVIWTVTSDMGFNPVFRIFGLFMDRMLGKTYELGLKNIASLA
ncbi:DUF6596 domain-containing protein [Roseobacteraceae bacterium S113]